MVQHFNVTTKGYLLETRAIIFGLLHDLVQF